MIGHRKSVTRVAPVPVPLFGKKNEHVCDCPIESSSELFKVHDLCISARFRDKARVIVLARDKGKCKQREIELHSFALRGTAKPA